MEEGRAKRNIFKYRDLPSESYVKQKKSHFFFWRNKLWSNVYNLHIKMRLVLNKKNKLWHFLSLLYTNTDSNYQSEKLASNFPVRHNILFQLTIVLGLRSRSLLVTGDVPSMQWSPPCGTFFPLKLDIPFDFFPQGPQDLVMLLWKPRGSNRCLEWTDQIFPRFLTPKNCVFKCDLTTTKGRC